MKWYIEVLKKYVDFSGRARRKEYWMFVLFNMIFAAASIMLDMVLGTAQATGINIIYLLYWLAVFMPSVGVLVRRLHDIGRSGGWFFIGFIPLIGAFILLFLLVKDSEPGANRFGENPKGVGSARGFAVETVAAG